MITIDWGNYAFTDYNNATRVLTTNVPLTSHSIYSKIERELKNASVPVVMFTKSYWNLTLFNTRSYADMIALCTQIGNTIICTCFRVDRVEKAVQVLTTTITKSEVDDILVESISYKMYNIKVVS